MASVFISYSHKDKVYAEKLAKAIESRGISVWIDDRIDYGGQWPRVIQENLEACQSLVVIMSTRSLESIWVQNELTYAMSNKKNIFPVLLEGTAWFSVSALQWADVQGGTLPPEAFFQDIKHSLPAAPARTPQTPPATKISAEVPAQKKQAPSFIPPAKASAQPSVQMGKVTVSLNAAGFSGWYIHDHLFLDGQEIPVASYSTDLKGFTKNIHETFLPVGEHHIKIAWGGDHPGQADKTFQVSKGNNTHIYLNEKLHFWRSYSEWSIEVLIFPVFDVSKFSIGTVGRK